MSKIQFIYQDTTEGGNFRQISQSEVKENQAPKHQGQLHDEQHHRPVSKRRQQQPGRSQKPEQNAGFLSHSPSAKSELGSAQLVMKIYLFNFKLNT
jgi:hypothetical protein